MDLTTFIEECRLSERDKKYVLLSRQRDLRRFEVGVRKSMYEDWLNGELAHLVARHEKALKQYEETLARWKREGKKPSREPDFRTTEEPIRGQRSYLQGQGMPFHIYVVATWIGIDSNVPSFAAREFRVVQTADNGLHVTGDLAMAKNGDRALDLRPIGSQILGPPPRRKRDETQEGSSLAPYRALPLHIALPHVRIPWCV